MDVVLKKQELQRLGVDEADEIHIQESAEFGGDIDVGAGVDEGDSGVYEIGLAFDFTGAETGDEASALDQADAGAGEADAFAIPERKKSACEIGIVKDRVET